MKITKGKLLTTWIAFTIFAYVMASQDWYTLSMTPNGNAVKLSSYDGLTSYSILPPILTLNFAAIFVVSFVGSWGRRIITWLMVFINIASLVWILGCIREQDISGLSKQVEQMTGIATVHGIKSVTIMTQTSPYIFIASLAGIIFISILILIFERNWPARKIKTEFPSKTSKPLEPEDAIGIWDSQRR